VLRVKKNLLYLQHPVTPILQFASESLAQKHIGPNLQILFKVLASFVSLDLLFSVQFIVSKEKPF